MSKPSATQEKKICRKVTSTHPTKQLPFYPPFRSATQSWFPSAQQAAARCQRQISKNAIVMYAKMENIPLTIFLRIYTPIASTVPACQYSPIAFIVFIP